MTQQGFTYLALIVDRSGSMSTIKTDMEGALNTLLVDQRKVEGKCQVSLYQFDDRYEALWEHRDIQSAPPITIHPRNSTALYDAIGRTINHLGVHFRQMNEEDRPEKVVVAIITDGLENSSREFDLTAVREMIRHQEDVYGWAFTYIGANQDAYAVGGGMGLAKGSTYNYGANTGGTQSVSASLSSAITRTRMAGGPANASYSFTEEEQEAGDATVK
jgi:von Willebrand factor type A domain